MTNRHKYPSLHWSDALNAVCAEIEAWELTAEETKNLCTQLHSELLAREEQRNEDAYERAYDPERMAASEESYRRDMKLAGRERQLK